jgi:RNAse (barnase) inhibitor barstar
MEKITFIKSFEKVVYTNSFIAYMETDISTENDIFTDLNEKLRFPNYFGYNWNSVWDLLRDFSWISEENIVIVYASETKLESSLQDEYFKLLIEASRDWKEGEAHFLQVVFPDSIVYKITELSNSDRRSFTFK